MQHKKKNIFIENIVLNGAKIQINDGPSLPIDIFT